MDSITSDSLQNMNTQMDWTPQLDMEFNTLEDAWNHWVNYGKHANGVWSEEKIYK
jgi:hypothetical protein